MIKQQLKLEKLMSDIRDFLLKNEGRLHLQKEIILKEIWDNCYLMWWYLEKQKLLS